LVRFRCIRFGTIAPIFSRVGRQKAALSCPKSRYKRLSDVGQWIEHALAVGAAFTEY